MTLSSAKRCELTLLRSRNDERGSTLVEFALVFILFMTMLLGIAGFGHALYAYHFVSNVAREATRWAAVNGADCADDKTCAAPASASDIDAYVKSLAPEGITAANITTTVTYPAVAGGPAICATTDNAPGCTVEVQVSYPFTFIFPLLPTKPLTLSSSSEMVIAH